LRSDGGLAGWGWRRHGRWKKKPEDKHSHRRKPKEASSSGRRTASLPVARKGARYGTVRKQKTIAKGREKQCSSPGKVHHDRKDDEQTASRPVSGGEEYISSGAERGKGNIWREKH